MVDISVVIPVKNGQKYIDPVLKEVFAQEIDTGFEVIIIDSGSCDGTLDIIKKYPVKLYQIKPEEFNHGLTRNFGISKSQGKYVILMTQDAIPYDVLWMKKMIEHFEGCNDIAGVYSRHIPHKDSSPLTRIRVNRFFTASEVRKEGKIDNINDYAKLSPEEKRSLCNFDDVSSCIRRQVWEKIPFSSTDFAEDLEWAERTLKSGCRIIYEPDSVVYHSHDFSVVGWYKRNRINSHKLFILFGLTTINRFHQLIAVFFLYIFRDIRLLCRNKISLKDYLFSACLVPLYSFSGALGQYIGSKDSKP